MTSHGLEIIRPTAPLHTDGTELFLTTHTPRGFLASSEVDLALVLRFKYLLSYHIQEVQIRDEIEQRIQ